MIRRELSWARSALLIWAAGCPLLVCLFGPWPYPFICHLPIMTKKGCSLLQMQSLLSDKRQTPTRPAQREYLEVIPNVVRELSLERNHGVACVWNSNIIQCRDRSRDLVGTQKAEDTKLSKTSIVEFSGEATFLGFFRHVLVEAKRIIEVYKYWDEQGNAFQLE